MADFDVYVGGPVPPPLRAALDPIPPPLPCFRSQLPHLSAPPFQGAPVTLGIWFFTF
jgi:hypothetical protein